MRILLYETFSLEYVARMKVRNFTEGLVMDFPQFQGLSPPTSLPTRSPARSCVVSDAMNLCKFYQNGRAPV